MIVASVLDLILAYLPKLWMIFLLMMDIKIDLIQSLGFYYRLQDKNEQRTNFCSEVV